MKRKHKAPKILAIVIVLILCFFSISNILKKRTALAEDKIISKNPISSNDSVDNDINNITDDKSDNTDDKDVSNIAPSLDGTTYKNEADDAVIKNTDDILVLVNKNRNLPSDYEPEDLVIPNVKFSFEENLQKKYMKNEAATALEELFSDANKSNINLFAVSGYRSYQRQEAIFGPKAKKYGHEVANKTSAVPGQSEHQTGLAMDVSCSSENYLLTEQFGQTPEGKWLKENAYRFGFIIRYPEDRIDDTGYNYEPWHIRYVGKEAATIITEKNIILEEYFLVSILD